MAPSPEHADDSRVHVDGLLDAKPSSVSQGAERGRAHPCPRKPLPYRVFGFPAQHFVRYGDGRLVELDDDRPPGGDQLGRPVQCTYGVTADADVAVSEQDMIPAAFGRQRANRSRRIAVPPR